MSGLGATCWLTGSFITKDQTFNLSVALLLLNFLSAAQDIAVDSLAVRILSDDQEIGIGNTIQVVAYKAGSVFAGQSVHQTKYTTLLCRIQVGLRLLINSKSLCSV